MTSYKELHLNQSAFLSKTNTTDAILSVLNYNNVTDSNDNDNNNKN